MKTKIVEASVLNGTLTVRATGSITKLRADVGAFWKQARLVIPELPPMPAARHYIDCDAQRDGAEFVVRCHGVDYATARRAFGL